MALQELSPTFDDPLQYFDFLTDIFATTRRRVPTLRRSYQIGPAVLQLSFAGEAMLAKLAPALEHLRLQEGAAPADFRISVWDSESTGVPMPPPPWGHEQYRVKGEIQGFTNEDVFTVYQHGSNALSMWNRHTRQGLFWARSAAQLPYYESGSPLRTLLHLWARDRGLQLVHAGAVGTAEGCVLIVGKGGMGKSTSAVGCLTAGLRYAGDDYVLLNPQPAPTVHSLFSSAKLGAGSLSFFPGLDTQAVYRPRGPEEKFLFLFWPRYSAQIIARMPLKAILIPRLQGRQDGSFEPISPVECLKALAPSTLAQLPGADPELFQNLCGYVKGVPAYRFHLPDAHRVPDAIRGLLGRL